MKWNKWENIFTSMIKKFDNCHEAYFGLGKILFFGKNDLAKALEMFELAIKTSKDKVYWLWAAFTWLYLYRQCPKHLPSKKQLAVKVEKYASDWLSTNKHDINALFILLHLVLDLEANSSAIKLKPKYAAEDLALWIKEADSYRGYLAWAEVYICRGKTKFATDVIEELIEFYPGNPEAYFRLWSMNKDNSSASMEIAGKMFLWWTNFYTLETK